MEVTAYPPDRSAGLGTGRGVGGHSSAEALTVSPHLGCRRTLLEVSTLTLQPHVSVTHWAR